MIFGGWYLYTNHSSSKTIFKESVKKKVEQLFRE